MSSACSLDFFTAAVNTLLSICRYFASFAAWILYLCRATAFSVRSAVSLAAAIMSSNCLWNSIASFLSDAVSRISVSSWILTSSGIDVARIFSRSCICCLTFSRSLRTRRASAAMATASPAANSNGGARCLTAAAPSSAEAPIANTRWSSCTLYDMARASSATSNWC